MAAYTLDDIKAAAAAKYASMTVEVDGYKVVLENALRLPKFRRDALIEYQEAMQEPDADQQAILQSCIRTVVLDPVAAELLLDEIGEDLAVLVSVFEAYSDGTQAGEASASDE